MWQIQSWRKDLGLSRDGLAFSAGVREGAVIALEELRYSSVTVEELAMILLALGRGSGDIWSQATDDDLRGLAEFDG